MQVKTVRILKSKYVFCHCIILQQISSIPQCQDSNHHMKTRAILPKLEGINLLCQSVHNKHIYSSNYQAVKMTQTKIFKNILDDQNAQ